MGPLHLNAVDQMISIDFVDHSVLPGLLPDDEGMRMQFGMFFNELPDLRAKSHEQIAIEVVATKWVHGGKITGHWKLIDQSGLMHQLCARVDLKRWTSRPRWSPSLLAISDRSAHAG